MPDPSLETEPDQLALNPKSISKPTLLDSREVSTVSLFTGSTSTGISGGQFNTAQGVTIIINESFPHHARTSSTNGSEPLVGVATERSELLRTTSENSSVTAEDTTIEEQSANAIYERQLLQKKHGFPLWIPQPNTELPVSYQQTGVSIGDVGLITSYGAFDYLFNICLASDHPSSPEVLPEGFSPLLLSSADIRKFPEHSRGSHLTSISVKKQRGLTFRGSKSEGAILAMPEGAHHEDLRNRKAFRDYASRNAASWYQFVNGPRGCELGNGELHLVTGCDKTTSWGIASYNNNMQSGPTQDGPVLTFLTVNGDDRHPLRATYSWEHDGMAQAKTWPEPDLEGGGDAPGTSWTTRLRNQSTFIRSFTIALSDAIWKNLPFNLASELETDAAMELKSPPTSSSSLQSTPPGSNSGPVVLTDWQSRSPTIHPSTFVLKILMQKHPEAKVAIVHDNDWCSVLEEDAPLPDGPEFFNRIQSRFDIVIDENGALYLAEKGIPREDGELSCLDFTEAIEAEKKCTLPVDQAALSGPTVSLNPQACFDKMDLVAALFPFPSDASAALGAGSKHGGNGSGSQPSHIGIFPTFDQPSDPEINTIPKAPRQNVSRAAPRRRPTPSDASATLGGNGSGSQPSHIGIFPTPDQPSDPAINTIPKAPRQNVPWVPPRRRTRLSSPMFESVVVHAHVTTAELHRRRVPEKVIEVIEENRAELQKAHAEQMDMQNGLRSTNQSDGDCNGPSSSAPNQQGLFEGLGAQQCATAGPATIPGTLQQRNLLKPLQGYNFLDSRQPLPQQRPVQRSLPTQPTKEYSEKSNQTVQGIKQDVDSTTNPSKRPAKRKAQTFAEPKQLAKRRSSGINVKDQGDTASEQTAEDIQMYEGTRTQESSEVSGDMLNSILEASEGGYVDGGSNSALRSGESSMLVDPLPPSFTSDLDPKEF